jgi:ribosomal protein S18 acetylase RimI-like enzyme
MQTYSDYAFTDEKVLSEIKDTKSTFYFANSADETIGYFKIKREATYKEGAVANGMQLERIYVLGKYQGQKMGQFMLEEVMNLARKGGAAYLWLGVWEKNIRAVRFYERNGFVLDGKVAFKLGEEGQWDYLMKLDL